MVWDMGGQDAIRQLWQHYYKNAQALIFVVDSADEERLAEARDELQVCRLLAGIADVPRCVEEGLAADVMQCSRHRS